MALSLITETLIPPILGVDANAIFSNKVDQMFGVQLPAWTAQANALGQSLVDAAASANYSAWSTTSNNIGTGAKSFNIGLGKLYVPGQFIMITNATSTANKMFCEVTGYAGGVLAVTSLRVWGAGAGIIAWHIGLSGPQGIGGDVWPAFAGKARQWTRVKSDETGLEYVPAGWTLLGTIPAASLNGQTTVAFSGIDTAEYKNLMMVGDFTLSASSTVQVRVNDGVDTDTVANLASLTGANRVASFVENTDGPRPVCQTGIHPTTALSLASTATRATDVTPVVQIQLVISSGGTFTNAGAIYLYGAR